MNTKLFKDSAVSPVIGVMLMLIVCIIIAAIVSGFAGSITGETKKAPQLSISAEARNFSYIMIKHDGGDSINWEDITVKTFIPSGMFKQMTYPVNVTEGTYLTTNKKIYASYTWAPSFSNGDAARFNWTDCFPADYYGVAGGACPSVGEPVDVQIFDKQSNKMITSKEVRIIP
nr:type IV pilin N-terminal domain-containing protein [uncultured Methanospirillum sp.]